MVPMGLGGGLNYDLWFNMKNKTTLFHFLIRDVVGGLLQITWVLVNSSSCTDFHWTKIMSPKSKTFVLFLLLLHFSFQFFQDPNGYPGNPNSTLTRLSRAAPTLPLFSSQILEYKSKHLNTKPR